MVDSIPKIKPDAAEDKPLSESAKKAVETAEKALAIAYSMQQKELAEEIQNRLELYKAGKAYYEK